LKSQSKAVDAGFAQNRLGNRSGAGFASQGNRLQKRLIGCPGFSGDMSARFQRLPRVEPFRQCGTNFRRARTEAGEVRDGNACNRLDGSDVTQRRRAAGFG
jgi:hypothetical protein